MSPTPWAALALALAAVAAVLVGVAAAVLLVLVIVVATIADAVAARRAPQGERRLPATLARGRPAALTVELTGPGAARARVRQVAIAGLEVLPREGRGGLEAELVATERGRHRLPPAAVRVRGPLGLASWDHAVGGEAEVAVLPDVPGARRIARAAREGRLRDPGRRPRGPVGLGTDFELVREYEPDDDIRHVNWRATIRTGKPMTNVFRVEQEREVVVLVDTGRLMAAPLGDRTRLDTALDAAAAVGYVADELGDRCGAVAFADDVRVQLPPSRRGGDALVRACFDLDARPVDSDPERAFLLLTGRKRAFVLVLTDLVDEAAARSLVDAVPVLARRHAVAVASVADPDLRALLATPPARAEDVPAAAVAADVTAAQEAAAARLTAVGAQVVDAVPDAFAAACVSAYLTSKTRARA